MKSLIVNQHLKGEQQSTDPYPWLAEDDERRNLTDRDIGEICLETSCFTQKQQEDLTDMLNRYKEVFIT